MRGLLRFLRRERGAAIVEFALVAPIFFLLVLGIMSFSRGYQRLNALNSALREGARMASAQQDPCSQRAVIKSRMLGFSQAFGFAIDTGAVTIMPYVGATATACLGVAPFTPTGTTAIDVGVSNYALFTGLNFLGVLQGITVTRAARFRWEYGP